jgi:sec-independent protein translocase protein TatB
MFDIFAWQHIVIMLVVALVVVGPKDLPRMMHMAGKWAGKARNMANEFRKSFDEMARETELDELRKEIENLKKNNPVSDMVNAASEVHSTISSPVDMAGGAAPRSGEFEVANSTAAPAPPSGPAVP